MYQCSKSMADFHLTDLVPNPVYPVNRPRLVMFREPKNCSQDGKIEIGFWQNLIVLEIERAYTPKLSSRNPRSQQFTFPYLPGLERIAECEGHDSLLQYSPKLWVWDEPCMTQEFTRVRPPKKQGFFTCHLAITWYYLILFPEIPCSLTANLLISANLFADKAPDWQPCAFSSAHTQESRRSSCTCDCVESRGIHVPSPRHCCCWEPRQKDEHRCQDCTLRSCVAHSDSVLHEQKEDVLALVRPYCERGGGVFKQNVPICFWSVSSSFFQGPSFHWRYLSALK